MSCPPKNANSVAALRENVMLSSIPSDPTLQIGSACSPMPWVVQTEGLGKPSSTIEVAPNSNALGQLIIMTDRQIKKRKKQIDYGKNTVGYLNYLREVPKDKRGSKHPHTPDVTERISKRRFIGKLHNWRRKLHQWDDSGSQGCAGSVPPPTLKSPVSSKLIEENKCSATEKMSLVANDCQ